MSFLKQIVPKVSKPQKHCKYNNKNLPQPDCTLKRGKNVIKTQIAGPFIVHVLHNCQHQTSQSYRGNKVMYFAYL